MFDSIISSIKGFGNFTEEDISLFTSKLQVINLAKNNFLLEEGQVCQSLYFLYEGSVRIYMIDSESDEHTHELLTANDWIIDYGSFTSQKPSGYFIQAFHESKILELNVYALHALIKASASFFRLGKVLGHEFPDYPYKNSLLSPRERYASLLASKPMVIQTFPMKYIASYLGMRPETLSRIRSGIRI